MPTDPAIYAAIIGVAILVGLLRTLDVPWIWAIAITLFGVVVMVGISAFIVWLAIIKA